MNSIWTKGMERPKFEALNGDLKTDVLVIGAGMAGILCAHMLTENGVDCTLVEKNTVCSGVTENTTAKITCQHGAIYDKMIKRFGLESSTLYYLAQHKALEKYEELSRKISCDFEKKDSYVYSLDNREKMEKEAEALSKIGAAAEFTTDLSLPFQVAGAVKVKNQAQFHPLKFAYALAKSLKIYENTRVFELTQEGALTENGKITAEKIIVATHFPFANKYGAYFLKMYQHRSYVLALEGAPTVDGMYVDEAEDGLSFRNYKNLLLLGGGGHRTGKQGGNWNALQNYYKKYYNNATEVCRWATQDCKTLDDIPYIGKYSPKLPNVYVATGFNKWGMTSSMVSAMLLSDMVQAKENDSASVFNPARSILRPRLAVNALETTVNLITPTAPRCPHLGCALKYNMQEHSWDCPCHGSRFSKNGKLLDNPATDDLKI